MRYRYRAVREVLGGSPIGEVAARYGASRQSVHTWRKRFEVEGMVGLIDRSRRPKSSPSLVKAGLHSDGRRWRVGLGDIRFVGQWLIRSS